jgi:CubicO group peptidase (beta-lactamase class C family)
MAQHSHRFAHAHALMIGAILTLAIPLSVPIWARSNKSDGHMEWPAFTQLFDTSVDHDKTVGASVLLVRDGRVAARHQHGLADRATGQPVTERTIFHYGSITKTLTAIAIMQLRDRGRLTLDDRVLRYVPELRRVHNPYGSMDDITIRRLLSHSAGFQNPTWPYKQGKPWEPFEPTTWQQLVAMMPYQEISFKPGARYSYSNPAFIYLARIIEELTGDPWQSYVQKNIFAPLNLTRSYFGGTPYYLAADRSHNYTLVRDANGAESIRDNGADFDPGITIPNGGWNAPLDDLATYLAFLTNATHGDPATERRYDMVLKHSSLEEMWNPLFPVTTAKTTPNRAESMGLSFFIVRRGSTRFIGHTGSQAGFLSFIYLNPTNRAAVVAAFNTTNDMGSKPGESAFQAIREAALKLIE